METVTRPRYLDEPHPITPQAAYDASLKAPHDLPQQINARRLARLANSPGARGAEAFRQMEVQMARLAAMTGLGLG